MQSRGFDIINRVIEVIFGVDILINFRTAYQDNEGKIITNSKMIAKRYLKFHFWVDFFAVFPFDAISKFLSSKKENEFQILGILKFIRVVKLKGII